MHPSSCASEPVISVRQEKWFGKLNKASFAIVMLSKAYWASGPCIEEVRAILRKGVKVYIVRVDDTCHTCTQGNFLGEAEEEIDSAGFIKLKLNMNCLPPPHEPLFQVQQPLWAPATQLYRTPPLPRPPARPPHADPAAHASKVNFDRNCRELADQISAFLERQRKKNAEAAATKAEVAAEVAAEAAGAAGHSR